MKFKRQQPLLLVLLVFPPVFSLVAGFDILKKAFVFFSRELIQNSHREEYEKKQNNKSSSQQIQSKGSSRFIPHYCRACPHPTTDRLHRISEDVFLNAAGAIILLAVRYSFQEDIKIDRWIEIKGEEHTQPRIER